MQQGLRVNATQDVVLRLLPAMVTTNEQIDEAFEILTGIVALAGAGGETGEAHNQESSAE